MYALAIKVIKNQDLIKRITQEVSFTEHFNSHLIEVLIGDLIFGQKLFQKYRRIKEVGFVMERTKQIFELYKSSKNIYFLLFIYCCILSVGDDFKKPNDDKPLVRYFRVNLLKTSVDDLIVKFEESGSLRLKKYSKNKISFKEYVLFIYLFLLL